MWCEEARRIKMELESHEKQGRALDMELGTQLMVADYMCHRGTFFNDVMYSQTEYPNAKLTDTEAMEWVSEIGEHWDKATTDKVYAQYKDVLMDLDPILFYVMMNYYYHTLHAKAVAMGKDNVEYYVAEIKEFLHTYKMFHNRM